MKYSIKLPLLFFCFFCIENLFARAGGGHGGGGGGGHSSGGGSSSYVYYNNHYSTDYSFLGPILIIGVVGVIIYSLTLSYLHFVKGAKSRRVLEKAIKLDSFWNIQKMKEHTFDVFCKMQKAWESRNLGPVKHLISLELYNDLDEKITKLRSENKKNILEEIEVNVITIMSCMDFIDNSKDEYTAQIDGRMIDYIFDTHHKVITENQNKEMAGFTDHYQFIRKNNTWILNKIINDVGIFDAMTLKSSHEKNK